jgi:hypothetical protein
MGYLHCEPPLSQMLEDPLTRVLMASDRVDPESLRELITTVRRRIAAADPKAGRRRPD